MRDIISPWGLFNNTFPFTVSLPLPLPVPSCLPLRHPFPHRLPGLICCVCPVPGPCLTTPRLVPPLLSSLSLPSAGRLLPPLGAQGFAQVPSSSFVTSISSLFSGLTAGTLPGLYCLWLGGSIFALRSSLP